MIEIGSDFRIVESTGARSIRICSDAEAFFSLFPTHKSTTSQKSMISTSLLLYIIHGHEHGHGHARATFYLKYESPHLFVTCSPPTDFKP